MPSDERIDTVLTQLAPAGEWYRSALRIAVEQVRGYLAACREGSADLTARAAAELGWFAEGRINAERFATMFLESEAPPAQSIRAVERALDVLRELETSGHSLFVVEIADGDDLRAAVDAALALAGRAFGAARIVELARTNRYHPQQHDRMLERFSFRMWNRAERRLAPPLVVSVDGRDLSAMALADFLDGAMKIVLVARGTSAPAPLARLITPATFVMQTTDVAALAAVAKTTAPAIGALLPAGTAQFTHDPSRGREAWQRLVVTERPKIEPRHPIGGISAAQQADDLRILDSLSPVPKSAAVAGTSTTELPAAPANPVDRLAAWLLHQAETPAAAES
jgi:hypothetical protein